MGINPSDLLSGNMLPPSGATGTSAPAPMPQAPTAAPAPASNAQQSIQNFNTQSAVNPSPRRKKQAAPASVPAAQDEEEEEKQKSPYPIPEPETETVMQGINSYFAKISVGSGLAIAFFTLVALIWLLVPTASGYTRAQLLWFTLLGQTKLTTDNNIKSKDKIPDSQIGSNPDQPQTPQELNNPGQLPTPTTTGQQPFNGSGPSIDFSNFDSLSIGDW